MLTRIKKKGLDGFKSFVSNLEGTNKSKRLEIIQAALMEDPSYVEWVMKNITPAEKVLELETEEVVKICNNLPNGMILFAKAFSKTNYHSKILNGILPQHMISDYLDAAERCHGLKKSEQEAAQAMVLKTTRELQDRNIIVGPIWRLPPQEVATEAKYAPKESGLTELKYENGRLAARGQLDKGRRVGEWEHFFISGNIMAKGEYDNNLKTGYWTFYYLDGTVKSQGTYRMDAKHGDWEERDKSGVVHEVYYDDGAKIDKEKIK